MLCGLFPLFGRRGRGAIVEDPAKGRRGASGAGCGMGRGWGRKGARSACGSLWKTGPALFSSPEGGPRPGLPFSYLIPFSSEKRLPFAGSQEKGDRRSSGLFPAFGDMMGAGPKCPVSVRRVLLHGVSKKRQTVGMNWKRAGWGAVAGVGGGNMYFGLTEDLPLFTVLGMACLLFGLFKLRALNRE